MREIRRLDRVSPYLPRSVQEVFERWVGCGAERGGFCVMLFGQVFRRWLRGRVNDREIEMRIGVIGISGDGFEYFFFRRFLPALLARSDAEIIVCYGALGIDGKRLGQFGERGIEFGLPIIHD